MTTAFNFQDFNSLLEKSPNFFDFIEIGTSDFDTELQSINNIEKAGISIEPVKYYLDNLPDKEGVIKANLAISDKEGECTVYYISPEIIKDHNFPQWMRGCNSINKYHPSVVRILQQQQLDPTEMFSEYVVSMTTLHEFISKTGIKGIYFLKVDTEGHDCVILKKFLEDLNNNCLLPHTIQFETNVLTNPSTVSEMLILFLNKGYDIVSMGHDAIIRLNINRLKNRSTFTQDIKNHFIVNYPDGYNPNDLPHENTLEAAKEYCIKNDCAGVTYQYDRYEVRKGPYLYYQKSDSIVSWVYE